MGQGVGVWNWGYGYLTLTLSVTTERKTKFQLNLNLGLDRFCSDSFLATFTILSNFTERERATLKVSTFLAYSHYFKITFIRDRTLFIAKGGSLDIGRTKGGISRN